MKFIVNGGKKLSGTITVSGSKNAALPALAATVLTSRPCVIDNLPLIGDVLTMIDILEAMGAKVEWLGKRQVRITNRSLRPAHIPPKLVRQMRASILLVGPLLARFGEVKFHTPGGCHIGVRPMDAHFDAFRQFGFRIDYDEGKDIYTVSRRAKKTPQSIILKEFSVTATENLLMFGALNPGFEIQIAAAEPHIRDLGQLLTAMGAEIKGLGTHNLKVKQGVDREGGPIKHTIVSDYVEAGTFLILGAVTGSDIVVKQVPLDDLVLVVLKLQEFGVRMEIKQGQVKVLGSKSKLRAVPKVEFRPHPGLPSDLQAPFGLLATQAKGETLIFDTIYEGRLKYLYELDKMGAAVDILGPHRAVIKGPKQLVGKNVESIDLRAGATLVIATLAAKGESILHGVEQIDRGYEKIDERLRAVKADIRREE